MTIDEKENKALRTGERLQLHNVFIETDSQVTYFCIIGI